MLKAKKWPSPAMDALLREMAGKDMSSAEMADELTRTLGRRVSPEMVRRRCDLLGNSSFQRWTEERSVLLTKLLKDVRSLTWREIARELSALPGIPVSEYTVCAHAKRFGLRRPDWWHSEGAAARTALIADLAAVSDLSAITNATNDLPGPRLSQKEITEYLEYLEATNPGQAIPAAAPVAIRSRDGSVSFAAIDLARQEADRAVLMSSGDIADYARHHNIKMRGMDLLAAVNHQRVRWGLPPFRVSDRVRAHDVLPAPSVGNGAWLRKGVGQAVSG